jgi:monofunctional biosynthetic peptidoglycan transglycosylase
MAPLGRWLLWTVALAMAALTLLQGWYAVHIWWWRDHPPRETAFMAMRLSERRTEHPDARIAYTWVPYERISVELKRAMVAAEDGRFIEHEGFDWMGSSRRSTAMRAAAASSPAGRRSRSSWRRTSSSRRKGAIGARARKR